MHVNDDADVEKFLLDPVVDYVDAAARAIGPSLVLIANTLTGKDVAGRLVATLERGDLRRRNRFQDRKRHHRSDYAEDGRRRDYDVQTARR